MMLPFVPTRYQVPMHLATGRARRGPQTGLGGTKRTPHHRAVGVCSPFIYRLVDRLPSPLHCDKSAMVRVSNA